MRFYVFSPRFHIRPKNTDWIYNKHLPRISEFTDGLEIYLQQALLPSLITNARLAAAIAQNRLKVQLPDVLLPQYEDRFSLRDLRRSGADIVFGHSPTNVHHLPLICHTGPIFEQAMLDKGIPQTVIDTEKAAKLRTVLRSQLVTLNSEAGADSIRALDPPSAWKIRSIPFFLHHLRSISESELEHKWSYVGPIKLLFVGREARRKGLPAVLRAFQAADAQYPGLLELTVVTSFADGEIPLPAMANLHRVGQLSQEEVGALMHQSHLLLMPSQFETYGWVYLEAMAAGAIAMACDAPVQREIVADGRAGILVQPNADAVTRALMGILSQPEEMAAIARRGWQRVQDIYLPEVVAEGMKQLGHEARELFQAEIRQQRPA